MMGRWAIINGLLALLLIGLGLGLASTWTRALPPVEEIERPAEAAPAPVAAKSGGRGKRGQEKAGARAELAPPALVKVVVEKDLFDPSRSKPSEEVKAAAPVAKETGPPSGVSLVGVQVVGRNREAFITDAGQGSQQRRLHVGDQVSGYTVTSIHADGIELTSPSGDPVTMTLTIEKKGTPPAGGPKPAVAAKPGQPQASPAAGVQAATSPAAGVGMKPPPPAPAPPRPGQPAAAPPPPVPAPPAGGAEPASKQPLGRKR